MTTQNTTPTHEEIEFQTKHTEAWQEVRQFLETERERNGQDFFTNNPQHQLAPEFFQIYLEKKPSPIAAKALSNAFAMWGNIKGVSDQVDTAIKHISYEEDVWDLVVNGLRRTFSEHDDRHEELIYLLQELIQNVVPLKSRSALLFTLSDIWEDEEETAHARQGFEQIIKWNASEWHVEAAQGRIYEFDRLNIGQSAPQFSLSDVNGNPIELTEYQGKVIVLHFWGTNCGWCQFNYPHLRNIAQEHPDNEVALIGVSDDTDFTVLRQKIKEEEFTWPQICEGNGWQDTLFKLYNIHGIPATYILDQEGKIAFKLSGGGEGSGGKLEESVRSLVA